MEARYYGLEARVTGWDVGRKWSFDMSNDSDRPGNSFCGADPAGSFCGRRGREFARVALAGLLDGGWVLWWAGTGRLPQIVGQMRDPQTPQWPLMSPRRAKSRHLPRFYVRRTFAG